MGKAPKMMNKEYMLVMKMLSEKETLVDLNEISFTKKQFETAVKNYLGK